MMLNDGDPRKFPGSEEFKGNRDRSKQIIMARKDEAFERDVHNWGDLSSRCSEVLWDVERGAVRNSWSQRRPHKRRISRRVVGMWESGVGWEGKKKPLTQGSGEYVSRLA